MTNIITVLASSLNQNNNCLSCVHWKPGKIRLGAGGRCKNPIIGGFGDSRFVPYVEGFCYFFGEMSAHEKAERC